MLVTGYLVSIGAKAVDLAPVHPDLRPRGRRPRAAWPTGCEGTVVLIFIASVVGIPVGMLAGIYLAEYETGSWLATPARFVCDVLTGVPSIVVGILGYELLVVPLGGNNGWAGALALAFIMIPIVARTTEEMLRLVPQSYREASIALGATKATHDPARGPPVGDRQRRHRRHARHRPRGRRDRAAAVHRPDERLPAASPPTGGSPSSTASPSTSRSPPSPCRCTTTPATPTPASSSLAWGGILVLISLIFVLNLAIRFVTRGRNKAA